MIAAAIVLAVVLLIAMLRIGVIAEYGEIDDTDQGDIRVYAVAGLLKLRIYPRKKTENKKPANQKAKENTFKAGRLVDLKNQLPAINTLLARLRRKLLINEMTIHYMAAGEDPAAAALWFGGANIGYGFLTALLENNFRIKKRDFRASVSFDKTEPYIYARARFSLAVWEAVYVASALIRALMRGDKRTAHKIRKAV